MVMRQRRDQIILATLTSLLFISSSIKFSGEIGSRVKLSSESTQV